MRYTNVAVAAAASLALVACQPSDSGEVPVTQEEVEVSAEAALTIIDTTAEAVWEHLQDVEYASTWDTWPGTEPYYEGGEPHGMLLTTYANGTALAGIAPLRAGAADEMPANAVIVKENYQPDSTLAAVTVMLKTRGYDAEHSDWFWMKRLPDGTVEASGRVTGCIDCHSDGTDYVMTDLASRSGEGDAQ